MDAGTTRSPVNGDEGVAFVTEQREVFDVHFNELSGSRTSQLLWEALSHIAVADAFGLDGTLKEEIIPFNNPANSRGGKNNTVIALQDYRQLVFGIFRVPPTKRTDEVNVS
jgi:hypothetical protein